MKGDSTTNQLQYLTHFIRSTWASGKIAHGLFLDVSAAFILYINDIKDDLESKISIFADDTTLIATGLNEVGTSAQIKD